MKKLLIILMITLSLGIFSGCAAKEAAAEGEVSTEETNNEDVIYVKSETVKEIKFSEDIILPGVAESFESVEVVSKISGDIESVNFEIGDKVSKGDLVVNIDDEQYLLVKNKAQLGLEDAKFTVDTLKRDYEKALELHKSGAIADTAMNDMEVGYKRAQLAYKSAQFDYDGAELNYSYTKIKSPIDGIIADTGFSDGETISPGIGIFKVVNLDKVYVNIGIPENLIGSVNVGDSVSVETYYGKDSFTGKIENIKPIIDTMSRTYQGKIIVDNSDSKIKDGMSLNVSISSEQPHESLGVNKTALVVIGDEKFVYVNDNNVSKLTKVKLGASSDDYYEVIEGLSLGDEVITDGSGMLKDGKKISIKN